MDVNFNQMTNKELEEVIKDAEEAYKESQQIVIEHYNIMDTSAKIYKEASELLNKRTGGRWEKRQEKKLKEDGKTD